MRRSLLLSIVLTAAAVPAWAGLDQCVDATCRVNVPDGSCGTGCVFRIAGGHVYVLTAGHVVGRAREVTCEFWRFGHQSDPMPGAVVACVENETCDAALVAVPEPGFGGLLPAVVPLAPANSVVQPGEPLASVGCAGGAWSTGWKGHVLSAEGSELRFVPPPANGRSGSALFDGTGERIVGVIRARTGDDQVGIACTLASLYASLANNVQCGPEGCPVPAGPLRQWQVGPRGGIFRYQDGGAAPVPANPWPTLQVVPEPVPRETDLAPIHEKLDRIAALLEQRTAPVDPAPPPAPPDSAAPAGQDGQRLVAVEREAATLKSSMGQLHTVIQQLVGDQATLGERIDARLEKVRQEGAESAGEIARAYARDVMTEKLADGTLGWTTGKLIAASLGVSGPLGLAISLAAWLIARRVGRRLESGEPLLVERLVDRFTDRPGTPS